MSRAPLKCKIKAKLHIGQSDCNYKCALGLEYGEHCICCDECTRAQKPQAEQGVTGYDCKIIKSVCEQCTSEKCNASIVLYGDCGVVDCNGKRE